MTQCEQRDVDRNRDKGWKSHKKSQQRVKSESEQKDYSLADSQRAELVSLTDNLNTSQLWLCSDCQAACSLPTMHLLLYSTWLYSQSTWFLRSSTTKNTHSRHKFLHPVGNNEEMLMLIMCEISYASCMPGLSLKPPCS